MHAKLLLSLTNFNVGVHDHDRALHAHGRVLHVHVHGRALHENGYALSSIAYECFLDSLLHLFDYGHDYIFIQAYGCGHDLYFFTRVYGYGHHGRVCSFCGHENLFYFLNLWMFFF